MTSSLSSHSFSRVLAALASTGAAVVHAAVVRDHWATWWVSGLFFVVLATVQLAWAPAVLRFSSRAVLWAAVFVNAGSAMLWAVTRLVGNPVGPLAGTPLPVGPAGLLVLALELLVCGSVTHLLASQQHTHRRRIPAVAGLSAAAAVVAALTVPGVTAALAHDHAGHAGGHAHGDSAGDSEGHGGGGEHGHQEEEQPPARSQDTNDARRDGHHSELHDDRPDSGQPKSRRSPAENGGGEHGHGRHSH
jgi:hypothetical protein